MDADQKARAIAAERESIKAKTGPLQVLAIEDLAGRLEVSPHRLAKILGLYYQSAAIIPVAVH